jgi:hypothetical protein
MLSNAALGWVMLLSHIWKFSAQRSANQTEALGDISQSFQAIAGLVPEVRLDRLLSNPIQLIIYCVISLSLDAVASELLTN